MLFRPLAALWFVLQPAHAQEGAAEAVSGLAASPTPAETAAATGTGALEASDPDNCLLCHGFPGLARLDSETGDLRLFFVSERFHADGEGPHTSLACTGCHDRAAVEKVPHETVEPVDCAQQCHLVSGSGSVVEFSHKVPAESLALSVHKPETLASQPYATPLLREGQSSCLYCHDDPVYRMPEGTDSFHRGVDPHCPLPDLPRGLASGGRRPRGAPRGQPARRGAAGA